jgi:phosphopantothenoylcysteine decarboxylase/phosphopantothenate--cysteine ligase
MLAACERSLPANVAVCAAAVCDWRMTKPTEQKIKKQAGTRPPRLEFTENPDILATLSRRNDLRPMLVIGFAAETANVLENATQKRLLKCCDWILANDVSRGTGTFGGSRNTVHLISEDGVESWPCMSKQAVAERLTARIADSLEAMA